MEYDEGSFMWAVEQMKKGKKVRRKLWTTNANFKDNKKHYYYIHKDCGENYILSSQYGRIESLVKNFEALDWEVFKETKKTLSDKISIYNDRIYSLSTIDVKDFIATIKEMLKKTICINTLNNKPDDHIIFKSLVYDIIDEEAGEQLK